MNTVVLTITLDQATGNVNVTGPIDNKFVAFGMIEMAKEAISEWHRQNAGGGKIVPVHGRINGNGGQPA